MKKLEGNLSRFTCERRREWEEAELRIQAAKNPVKNDPEPDDRSLYEKLQANKIIKDEECQETLKISSLIRTLDDDEIDFLDKLRKEKMEVEKEAKRLVQEGLEVFRRERQQFDQSIQQSIYRSWSAAEISKSPETSERPSKKMKGMALKGVILKKNKDDLSKQNHSESKNKNGLKNAENTSNSNHTSLSEVSPEKNKKTSEIPEPITSSVETSDQKLIVYTSGSDE